MKLEPNQIIGDRYQIIEQIGTGGMANVYCANDIKLDREITLKVLKEEFVDEEFIRKFRKEATAAAKLNHPNIAGVYDVGNDGNIYYIVMEYVDGYTLKDIIKIKAPFSNEEILGISIQIANALSVAHNAGIVHRDIKPQNILVTKDGNAKVTDFGIARASSSNTITTDAMGSVHYFSPEQARGSYTDFKTDIYSLGIVMFEMATGRIPFEGDGVVQLAMKHINEPLPNIKMLNANVSDSLEKIILKATQKNVDNRYKTASLLIEDLKKALYDESGNFIKEDDFADSPTVVISPEQIQLINELSKNNLQDEQITIPTRPPRVQKQSTNQQQKPVIRSNNQQIKTKTNSNNKNSISASIKEKQEKDMEKKVALMAILTGLCIVLVLTSFLVFLVLTGKKSEVPDFKGKTYEQAVELAKEREIYIRNTEEKFDDLVEKGSIISQSIEAGKTIKKGETVDVTISLGTGKFELMDFTGMDISEVYSSVEDIKIKLTEKYISDSKVERGKVVRQDPKAGTTIKPDEEVTLYISKGEEEKLVVVPNLLNLTESEAKSTLKNIGLSVGRISKSESNSVEEGKVISQSINYGNEVEEGKAISLVISSGKPKETTTETTTVTTTETTTKKEETSTETVIIETTIEDTTNNNANTTQQSTETTTSEPVLKSETLVISPKLPEGTESVEVKVVQNINGVQKEIYVQSLKPDQFPVQINVRGSEPTEYQLYIDGKLIGTETKFN